MRIPAAGNPIDDAFEALYQRLRRVAHKLKARDKASTLNATALLHEAYLDLAASQSDRFTSREHLFNSVVVVMRHLLVDASRRRIAQRRGGGAVVLSLDEASSAQSESVSPEQVIEIHLALDKLAAQNAQQARIFEFHFFGGLTQTEIAELMGIMPKTVGRHLRLARAHLGVALTRSTRAGTEAG